MDPAPAVQSHHPASSRVIRARLTAVTVNLRRASGYQFRRARRKGARAVLTSRLELRPDE